MHIDPLKMTDMHSDPLKMTAAEAMRIERDRAKRRHPANPDRRSYADEYEARRSQYSHVPPATSAQQIARAQRMATWLESPGRKPLTLVDVRMIAEYVLGYNDQEPWESSEGNHG